MLTRANKELNREVAELVAGLHKSNKEVMALKMGLLGRPTPTQQLAKERQCERRQQQLPHQQAERAQTPVPAALQTMEEETVEDETTAVAGPVSMRRATESLKERRINERLNRMEEQHNATTNAFDEHSANIDSALQQNRRIASPERRQQHLEQATERPDVIVLQETLIKEVNLPGYKVSVSPLSLWDTTGSTGRGASTLVRKGITFLEHKVLGTNSPIEHTSIEVANHIASPSNRLVVCGDINAPNQAWGYGRTLVKGRDLLQDATDATDLGLTRITDTADPMRIGNSPERRQRQCGDGRLWRRNTGHELGSGHYIVEIAVSLSSGSTGTGNGVRTHRALPVKKVVTEDIEEWMAGLTERAAAATREIETDAGQAGPPGMMASATYQQEELHKKIAELNQVIEAHCRTLRTQQWHEICSTADGQMHCSRTWNLLRHLLDETKQSHQRGQLTRIIHTAVAEGGEDEVPRLWTPRRRTMPPPQPGLTKGEAVMYRQLQNGSLPTPVLMKHNPSEARRVTTVPPWLVATAGSDQLDEQTRAVQWISAALEKQRQSKSVRCPPPPRHS
ncbi:hypothetical protein HPB50_000003 [Hyalomma asiaticum]|uniref:Uncharacterized protein n=1 Tax=Hyalomma asiaticum TaxID=266040 RepID=A0ACB7S1W5_HYAAI|nr:hypothetical protein HPB50_000003 [Hyalomma asiaticum]